MALLILALLQRIFLMSSLMLLLVWLIFFMVLIKLLPILGTISGKTVKLMVLALICLGNNRQDSHPPNCMVSCLEIVEAFVWVVFIKKMNVTLIILTLSVSRLLNLLLRLVAFLLFLNPQCLASISRWITASSSWKRFCLFVCRALSSIMVICMLTAIRLLLTFVFFQAEDGIRDYKVTGVQTCALPISSVTFGLVRLFSPSVCASWHSSTRPHRRKDFSLPADAFLRTGTAFGPLAWGVFLVEIGRASCRERV